MIIYILLYFNLVLTAHSLIPILISNATYEREYYFNINSSIEYILEYENITQLEPLRITVSSKNSSKDMPLMVVVRQTKEILSWQLPLIVNNDFGGLELYTSSRTLCPNSVINLNTISYLHRVEDIDTTNKKGINAAPVISISTASKYNISFHLAVTNEESFFIELTKDYNITVSPSEPKYFFYSFDQNVTNKDGYNLETVILQINSDDYICMTVSIQNASCPVYDLNHDIKFQGLWETVDKKGGITISSHKFPNGFFVVMVAHADDSDCAGSSIILQQDRHKNITFTIQPSISYEQYTEAVLITLCVIVLFYTVFITLFFLYSKRNYKPKVMESIEESDGETVNDAITPSTTTAAEIADNISFDETEYDTIAEADYDKEVILGKPALYLRDLARKDPRILKRKSYLYLWQVLTVALFYGLPVIQLVITYQKVLNDTGNQDLCYYNFLCAHPLGFLSDFNHLFSNIGYIMFGVLFLLIVHRREKQHNDINFDKHYGIPQHYGLFYAMAVALIMEGVLSGSYHVCPNHLNFQFDSSFMYIMAVLCMVKLYQTRHPDINATAYATFGVLAVAILLGMIGVLEANIYFWISFTVLHIVVCLILTIQVYYLGCWKFDKGLIKRIIRIIIYDFWSGPINMLKPVYKGRMVLLVLGNVTNWLLAAFGIYHHDRDFAIYLLAILLANTMLYFVFYLVMKLLHKEKINMQTTIYLILATTCAISAMYFFYHKSISWALSPAQSRRFNQDCKLLQFYDYHDIWHFLSATGMFFTFMVLLTLDDDLSHTHHFGFIAIVGLESAAAAVGEMSKIPNHSR